MGVSVVRGLLLATGLSLLGLAPARAADEVTLQLDWIPGGIAAGWYYGASHGCFTDQGITLRILRGFGAGDAITKVATGAAPFGLTDLGALITSRVRTGATVKGIMPVVSDSPFSFTVLDETPIRTIQDLEGHRIAASAGGAAMAFLPIAMKLAGGDFAKVAKQTVDGAVLIGLLLQGKVDAITTYVTNAVNVEQVAQGVGKKTRTIAFGERLEMYNAAAFTSDRVIAENPGLVKRFRDGAVCAFTRSNADVPGAIDAIVAGVQGLQRESQVVQVPLAYRMSFDSPTFKANGFAWNKERVAHTVTTVLQAEAIDSQTDPANFVYSP